MVEIVQKGDPVLRAIAKAVPIADLKSSKFKKILKDMKAALATQDDGVALAAPQVGHSLRLFIVSTRALSKDDAKKQKADMVFVNPEIVKLSKSKKLMDEGCLSVRPLYGNVKRSDKATIRAYDEKGVLREYGASGLLAQIFQHEIDHLDGILFIDKAEDVFELTKESEPHVKA